SRRSGPCRSAWRFHGVDSPGPMALLPSSGHAPPHSFNRGVFCMIKLDHVRKVYKDTVIALDDVSIEIGKGEFVLDVGPSGSGKSTLISLLIREEQPNTGEIFVAGKNIAALPSWKVPYLRRNLGTIVQDF